MVHTKLYSKSFPVNINDLRSPSNYPFVGMLSDNNSLLYSYESIIKQNDDEATLSRKLGKHCKREISAGKCACFMCGH